MYCHLRFRYKIITNYGFKIDKIYKIKFSKFCLQCTVSTVLFLLFFVMNYQTETTKNNFLVYSSVDFHT